MVDSSDRALAALLRAVSDTTRRSLLAELCQRGRAGSPTWRAATRCRWTRCRSTSRCWNGPGLVSRRTVGRAHYIAANLDAGSTIEQWLNDLRSSRDLRLERLEGSWTTEAVTMNELTVRVSRTIDAPIEQVFDAWLDPGMLQRFIRPAEDMPAPEVETDAVEGGGFTIVMQAGDEVVRHTGTYLEVSRPTRLAFTWNSTFTREDSTVTLDFAAGADGSTTVELTHVRFPSEEARDNHDRGWDRILAELGDALG